MSFIFGLLGGLLGIILAVVIIIFIIYTAVRRYVGGVNLKQLYGVAKNVKDLQRQEYSREKEVNGMTKLYEPQIIEDFGDFNKELLYNVVEKGLTSIFNSIENKSMKYIKENKDLKLLEPELEEYVNDIKNREVIILDPMLATGGSGIDAIELLKKEGVKKIKFLCIIAAPEGIKKIEEAHPDVQIYCTSIDDHLNEVGYIVPGLGDAGDRIFETK